jgi:hypothetical protein
MVEGAAVLDKQQSCAAFDGSALVYVAFRMQFRALPGQRLSFRRSFTWALALDTAEVDGVCAVPSRPDLQTLGRFAGSHRSRCNTRVWCRGMVTCAPQYEKMDAGGGSKRDSVMGRGVGEMARIGISICASHAWHTGINFRPPLSSLLAFPGAPMRARARAAVPVAGHAIRRGPSCVMPGACARNYVMRPCISRDRDAPA